jgi:hypothetical protein
MTARHWRTRAWTRLSVPAVAAGALACAAPYGFAQGTSPARQWAAEAVRELGLQGELPRRADDPPPYSVAVPKELVWVAVLGGVGVFAFYLSGLLPSFGGGSGGAWDAADGDPDASGSRPAADAAAADAVARAGRFAEAMHMTLLVGVAAIRDHFGEEIADSLTSREILRRGRLPEAGRGFLREIVARVERSHFGRHPAAGSDYAACRAALDGLLQALRRERA